MDIILKYFSDFTDKQIEQFKLLEPLYKEWNEKINVVSRKDIESLYLKHVLHSLSIAALFEFTAGMEVVDIGTGGGFPGIPLAIFFPDVQFLLVDSINKKLNVVNDIVQQIDLKNVTTLHTRIESIKNKKFDVAVSRAVAPLKDLWRWSKPLLNQKSKIKNKNEDNDAPCGLICLKGGDLSQEIYESHTKPRVWKIDDLFKEDFFEEKYILQVL